MALLVVMVFLASAALLASHQLHTQQRNIKQASYLAIQSQAVWYALAAEEWAKAVLERDRRDNDTDSYSDLWGNLGVGLELPEGVMSVALEDAQSRLNINALRASGEYRKFSLERLSKLVFQLGLNSDVVNAIDDWIDPDNEPSGFTGAEDGYYSRLTPAYLAANDLMAHPAELLFIRGMTQEVYEKLSQFVSALDPDAILNINTAPRDILLVIGLSPEQANTVLEQRERKPFASLGDFVARVGLGKSFPLVGLGVSSDYFLLKVQIQLGGVTYAHRSLISRKGNHYKVVWRVRWPFGGEPVT